MKKETVTERIGDFDVCSLFDVSLDDAIEALKSLKASLPPSAANANVYLRATGYDYSYAYVMATRELTEEEISEKERLLRLEKEKKAAKKKREKAKSQESERKLYERLRKKFEKSDEA